MLRFVLIFIVLMWIVSCTCKQETTSSSDITNQTEIHIVKRSWHTNIIVRRSALGNLLPELARDFSDSKYLEISWGDKRYFMAEKGTVSLALRAALLPTQSVLRVHGLTSLDHYYSDRENFVSINIHPKELRNMMRFIEESFVTDDEGRLIKVYNDTGGKVQFYYSSLTYWGWRTCNVWTGRAIKAAGVAIVPLRGITAGSLMRQIKNCDLR
ncbi:MAG: DUF2459 domain-containing protein [Bacteroidales bacterium]